MVAETIVDDRGFPELQRLARELLSAPSAELSVLEQIATLAAGLAGRLREQARQQLIDQVVTGAAAILPGADGELRPRLGHASADELSALVALLDAAASARGGLDRADADMMAARARGDYAAMAPLALAADAQKNAVAAAAAEFAARIGVGADPAPASAATSADASPTAAGEMPEAASAVPSERSEAAATSVVVELQTRAQPERRLRALIRQMRPDATS